MVTPPPMVCVFVSSTWLDLQPERQAVEAALSGWGDEVRGHGVFWQSR